MASFSLVSRLLLLLPQHSSFVTFFNPPRTSVRRCFFFLFGKLVRFLSKDRYNARQKRFCRLEIAPSSLLLSTNQQRNLSSISLPSTFSFIPFYCFLLSTNVSFELLLHFGRWQTPDPRLLFVALIVGKNGLRENQIPRTVRPNRHGESTLSGAFVPDRLTDALGSGLTSSEFVLWFSRRPTYKFLR